MSIAAETIGRAKASYRRNFGAEPDALIHAPGRVNLIGEHTDYNDGFVLPMAINYGTVIACGAGQGQQVQVVAADYGDALDEFDLSQDLTRRDDLAWSHHVRGVAQALRARGHDLKAARFAIAGDIPQGAGLSSSASLGVAMGMAFARTSGISGLSATDFAQIAQQSENEFVGTACGIMDQLVSARAEEQAALLIDCRSLECMPVSMPGDVAILIIHSGVERELADSTYNIRRSQCEGVAAHFDVAALRDISLEDLERERANIDPVAYRRARHVITENDRVLAAQQALGEADLILLGELMATSHASMRDDFEITVPKIDQLVQIAQAAIGQKGGARMTGGGFGGCIVAIMPAGKLESVKRTVLDKYRTDSGGAPRMIDAVPSAGAKEILRDL